MNVRLTWIAVTLRAILVAVAIQACTGAPASTLGPSASVPASPTASPTAPTATAPAPTPSRIPLPNAAPIELQGKWSAVLAPGDQATLRIGETVFLLYRGGSSITGKIFVDGDTIRFFDSPQCLNGSGTYRWAIAGDILTFELIGERDPCPRTEVLGKELKRVPS